MNIDLCKILWNLPKIAEISSLLLATFSGNTFLRVSISLIPRSAARAVNKYQKHVIYLLAWVSCSAAAHSAACTPAAASSIADDEDILAIFVACCFSLPLILEGALNHVLN
jgi:hypothetical protein